MSPRMDEKPTSITIDLTDPTIAESAADFKAGQKITIEATVTENADVLVASVDSVAPSDEAGEANEAPVKPAKGMSPTDYAISARRKRMMGGAMSPNMGGEMMG